MIDLFHQALQIDPGYARAYCGLADCYGVLGNSYLPPNESFPQAKSYAAKALALDDSLGQAHASMGAIKLYYDWDWAEAEKELKRANELDPGRTEGFEVDGDLLETSGRLDEALAERRRDLELDPLSAVYNMTLGATLYFCRRPDEAIAQLEKAVEMEPHLADNYQYLGEAYEQKGIYDKAIATYEKGIMQTQRYPYLLAALGHAYATSGEREPALSVINELHERSQKEYISPYLFAIVYLGLSDRDQTFIWLNKAFDDRSFFLLWLNVEPSFDTVRSDKRFTDLLRRIRHIQ